MGEIDYNRILRKARILVARLPWKKILAFCFCLILSIIFWFIQIYRQSFNTTYNIPIKYVSVPEFVVFQDSLPNKATVTIRDNGAGLFKNFFAHRHDTIVININNILKQSSNKTLQGAFLEQLIIEKLSPSAELLNYNPFRISFDYSSLEQKKIPILFDGQVTLSRGYLLNGEIRVTPDSVIAYGAKDALNSLHYAYTVNDTIQNYKSAEPLIYKIKEIHNIKFVPNKVQVTVPVDEYTQKNLQIPITCINAPSNIIVKFFPSTVKVSFLVGLSKYESITTDDFSIQFDYNDLRNLDASTVALRITSSPDFVQSLFLSTTEAEFIFEKE